jgi:hypothetical protein
MVWFGIWVLLVLAALGVFFLLGRDLWRKAKALTRELGVATDRLSAVSDQLADISGPDPRGSTRSR